MRAEYDARTTEQRPDFRHRVWVHTRARFFECRNAPCGRRSVPICYFSSRKLRLPFRIMFYGWAVASGRTTVFSTQQLSKHTHNRSFLVCCLFPCKVMASGMTTSTAERNRSCDTFYLDEAGLRTHAECDLVQDPNFGLLQVRGTRRLSITSTNPLGGGGALMLPCVTPPPTVENVSALAVRCCRQVKWKKTLPHSRFLLVGKCAGLFVCFGRGLYKGGGRCACWPDRAELPAGARARAAPQFPRPIEQAAAPGRKEPASRKGRATLAALTLGHAIDRSLLPLDRGPATGLLPNSFASFCPHGGRQCFFVPFFSFQPGRKCMAQRWWVSDVNST